MTRHLPGKPATCGLFFCRERVVIPLGGPSNDDAWRLQPAAKTLSLHQANCLYQSAVAADGKPHNVGGAMQTIMAGLACGEPNIISWPILRDYAAAFISADDHLAANGMRIAAAPRPGTDPAFISGESGAIGLGLLYELKTCPQYQAICRDLALDDQARVLLISTEGDTSPDIYEAIVWQGRNH